MAPGAVKEKVGRPLLHYALFPNTGTTHTDWRDRKEIVQLLLESGSDPSEVFGQHTVRASIEDAYTRSMMRMGFGSSSTLRERHEFLGDVRALFEDYRT